MKTKNHFKAWVILGLYLTVTCMLLFVGYSVQKPAIKQQEFPFSITYSYRGNTETISEVYVGEYAPTVKYLGDDSVAWVGYIKDHDRLSYNYYTVVDLESQLYSINLNIEPGYLMGDPQYADSVCQPIGEYCSYDGIDGINISDPAELEKLGFTIDSWEYPSPIENSFSYGGFSLSSEATVLSTVIAIAALLACMILIRKDPKLVYGKLDKFSAFLNFLVAVIAFPFIFVVSFFSEIIAEVTFWQQILFLAPALTAVGIAASLTLRRLGYKYVSFYIQFTGLAFFALSILL